GMAAAQHVYGWDCRGQLLHLRAAELRPADADHVEDELFSERFLVRRPLLRAIDHRQTVAPVLLVDEVDRADDEFEAFLLEILSDYSVTVPELGTFHADVTLGSVLKYREDQARVRFHGLAPLVEAAHGR